MKGRTGSQGKDRGKGKSGKSLERIHQSVRKWGQTIKGKKKKPPVEGQRQEDRELLRSGDVLECSARNPIPENW